MSKFFKALSISSFAFLVACGTAPETGTQPPQPSGEPTQIVGEGDSNNISNGDHIVWATLSDPVSLDPIASNDSASTDATTQMFEGLVRFDPNVDHVSLVPWLAESFGQIDEYTWYFNIRQGIYFHDGAYLNAEAAALSINRSLDIENHTIPAFFVVEMIESAVAVDEYTLHITTRFPFAPLPGHLAHRIGFIVSPLAIEEEANGGRLVADNPQGTGPFRLASRSHGNNIVFERNENYWGELALPSTLEFLVVPEPSTRFAMVETGEAQAIPGQVTDLDVALATPQLDVTFVQTTSLNYIGFNTNPDHPYLSNHLVRQAIAMAINRADIVDHILQGIGIPADGMVAPMVAFAPQDPEFLPYDPDAARELLAQAGFPNGFTLNFWYNDGNSVRGMIGVFVQAALAEIGITVNVSSLEWGAYLEHTAEGLHDMFILGWVTVTGDADYALFPLLHTSQHGSAGNRFFYSNPRVDYLLEAGRSSTSGQERYAIYSEIVEIINQEVPLIPINYAEQLIFSNGIGGLLTDFANTPHFRGVYIRR
ncbi:MAG: ABC transporter substrate-binding protein [Defluviitaleaceae bacterium]|nr:ABC transporter substrate-binding protein [Defluviitaleaceae bacterium]